MSLSNPELYIPTHDLIEQLNILESTRADLVAIEGGILCGDDLEHLESRLWAIARERDQILDELADRGIDAGLWPGLANE